jgi:two-component system cell cycle sensor histidine kinase/response regulator CckA
VKEIKGMADQQDQARILLVEDEETVRNVVARLLVKLGYEVSSAAGAKEAIAMFDNGADFDLVVTDIVMPGLSGVEMAEVLKGRFPTLRFLFISGYTSRELGNTPQPPPEPFLPKPFSMQELAEEVRMALAD